MRYTINISLAIGLIAIVFKIMTRDGFDRNWKVERPFGIHVLAESHRTPNSNSFSWLSQHEGQDTSAIYISFLTIGKVCNLHAESRTMSDDCLHLYWENLIGGLNEIRAIFGKLITFLMRLYFTIVPIAKFRSLQ